MFLSHLYRPSASLGRMGWERSVVFLLMESWTRMRFIFLQAGTWQEEILWIQRMSSVECGCTVFIKKYQVTVRDYLLFLNDLSEKGRKEEALAAAPRERSGMDNAQGALLLGRSEEGQFFLQPDTDGDLWEEEWPILMVDWQCILAYLSWISERTGQWRLPFSLEWEKSARGVDGRFFSWHFFDPSWCWTTESHYSTHTQNRFMTIAWMFLHTVFPV